MSTTRMYNWFLVEWSFGAREVINVDSLLTPRDVELRIGQVFIATRREIAEVGTVIARSRGRSSLEAQLKEDSPVASCSHEKVEENPRDYSKSASSRKPRNDETYKDSDQGAEKKQKTERCWRLYPNKNMSKKVLTPSNKMNTHTPAMKKTNKNVYAKKPDFTRQDTTRQNKSTPVKITVDANELKIIRNELRDLYKMFNDYTQTSIQNDQDKNIIDEAVDRFKHKLSEKVDEEKELEEHHESDEFSRSDDNVLITNKYDRQLKEQVLKMAKPNVNSELVPIGSGITTIHKDKYKKINWTSHTRATRTMLIALFSRRTLATHSLTGKKSPAFQKKPAKMCLNPKIVSDIVIEITDRFKVKENQVRSIITTKCADECKMWKQRLKRQTKNKKKVTWNENVEVEAKPID